ncbi:hypothetical protein [Williamsia sterculiae]|uniref:Uncharacterized protein n=1 Tax=Williamsia sterculiae TaxID=1344003 RepID=A0A1N7E1Y3_9NOCA|nr:hypothetical protein [Williamsia sterculiae]SIR82061.1 hypothetical protein SAMN05445060_1103 [Williamsia sterculiae]
MRSLRTLVIVLAGLTALLTACDASGGSATSRAPSTVTVTPTTTESSTPPPDTTITVTRAADDQTGGDDQTGSDGQSGGDSGGAATSTDAGQPPAGQGTGGSAYLGHWQRHDSSLEFGSGTGSILLGSSCCDVEKWSFTWADGGGSNATMTLGERIALHGEGAGADLRSGQTFTATPSQDAAGTAILLVADPNGFTSTWCRAGGGSPDCGA